MELEGDLGKKGSLELGWALAATMYIWASLNELFIVSVNIQLSRLENTDTVKKRMLWYGSDTAGVDKTLSNFPKTSPSLLSFSRRLAPTLHSAPLPCLPSDTLSGASCHRAAATPFLQSLESISFSLNNHHSRATGAAVLSHFSTARTYVILSLFSISSFANFNSVVTQNRWRFQSCDFYFAD